MLEPINALAFEMHAAKGVFALLLGSGISRSAKIPTGWEITLELVKRIAATQGVEALPSPESWYTAQHGEAPDYSKLLDAVASTPPLRQQVIKPFIEPNEEEGRRGEKTPTAAHRAIADLMAKGYVRVVVTTNFDRLLEQALIDLNVHANVLSSVDHISGAMPLTHAGPTIVKVHGDYLDTRIRNTTRELETYEPELDALLDRVFDEYGLIVCGWSADWDVALKAAIDRASSRRFPMYWAARGKVSTSAESLIQRRQGKTIEIKSADDFFAELEEKVRALESISRPHPLSTELAVALMKEYLPEARYQIRLHDLLVREREEVFKSLAIENLPVNQLTEGIFQTHVQRYEAALSTLIPLAYFAGVWSKDVQTRFWKDTLIELSTLRDNLNGYDLLIDLRLYPAVLVMYAFLLGAVVGHNYDEFTSVATLDVEFPNLGRWLLCHRLNATCLLSRGQDVFKQLPGLNQAAYAVSERLAQILRPISRLELPSDSAFNEAFARVEMALSLSWADAKSGNTSRIPTGRFSYQYTIQQKIVREWEQEYDPFVTTSASLINKLKLTNPPMFAALGVW